VTPLQSRRRTKSGVLLDVSIAFSVLRDETGAITGMASIARDITNEKRAENELRELAGRLQVIIRNIPVILFATDPRGRITLFEGRGIEDLSLNPGALLGRHLPVEWETENFAAVLAGEASSLRV